MAKESMTKNIVLAITLIVAAILGVLSGSYMIMGLYIVVTLITAYIMKNQDTYDLLYGILLISLTFDYTLHVPGIESIYMFHIILGVFTLISIYKLLRDKDVFANINKVVLGILILWFIYMCASILWAESRSLAIKYIAIYIMMFAFILDLMIYNINKIRINKTINLLLAMISFIVLVGFIEVLLGKQLPVKHYIDGFIKSLPQWQINTIHARPIAFSYNTNNLTATLAILSPICLFAIYRFENIIAKIWFTLISCIGFTLVVITTSRTGYFAFLFGFAVFLIYSIINIRNLGIGQIIYPIVLIVGFILAFNYGLLLMNIEPVDDGGKVMQTSLSGKLKALEGFTEGEKTEEGSTLHRMEIINNVLTGVIKEKNFQGFGVGNVEQVIRERGNTGSVYSPHCYPIEILGDFGLPGIILYGVYYLYLLLGNLIIGIRKKKIMNFAAVAGLIAFAPASFGPSSITYVFSYWVLMGFSIACIQVYRKEDNSGYRPTSSIKEFRYI